MFIYQNERGEVRAEKLFDAIDEIAKTEENSNVAVEKESRNTEGSAQADALDGQSVGNDL
jgi:hypothetical protein